MPETIVIAGAGYAGLHVALRLGSWLDHHRDVHATLIDRYDYHQVLTELPRVATGTRSDESVRVGLGRVLSDRIKFVRTDVTGFDLAGKELCTEAGPFPYSHLVLALGSRPNDFDIPGLAEHVLYLWSVDDAERVREAVAESLRKAARTDDPAERERLMTVVIGGGGATGVELAGAMAEEMPKLARDNGLPADLVRIILVEAGHTILAGSSQELIARAMNILRDLGVDVRTNAAVAEAIPGGFKLKSGYIVKGGVFVWAGGVKAPDLTRGSGLRIGHNGRIKVDAYLQALDHPDIYVAGDLASVVDPETGHVLPPLAQIALEEGETVVHNLEAAIDGRPLEPFKFQDRGFVVSVGGRRGVADVAGRTFGGRLASVLKDAIEWEYRQSVKHLRGWSVV